MGTKSLDEFKSIKIARILMKATGFWVPSSKREKKLFNALMYYSIFALGTAVWMEIYDVYLSIGDFYAMAYVSCSALPTTLVVIQTGTCLYHRKRLYKLIKFTEENFWYAVYDEFGRKVLKEAENKGFKIISSFMCSVTGTVTAYAMIPIIDNIHSNGSERKLPFNIWIGGPTSEYPYFQIGFLLEVIALLHAGLCFVCFDNFLGLLNIHVAGQFRILGHRLQKIFQSNLNDSHDNLENEVNYHELKECILQHQMLIKYVAQLEYMFTYATMCHLLISSIMICVAGFQLFLVHGSFLRGFLFGTHITGSFLQLSVITITSNDVLLASSDIGRDAYKAGWELSLYKAQKNVKSTILMIMLRASRPCCITAGGFFPVSTETFTAVISTAFSYLAMLRKFDRDLAEN